MTQKIWRKSKVATLLIGCPKSGKVCDRTNALYQKQKERVGSYEEENSQEHKDWEQINSQLGSGSYEPSRITRLARDHGLPQLQN